MMLKVYTDGSCLGNPGAGGFAVILCDENNDVVASVVGGEKFTTNNRMELMAIIKALEHLKGTTLPAVIFSDSRWAISATDGSWNIKKNLDLVTDARRLYDELHPLGVSLLWVPGHSGVVHNEAANDMAQEEAKKWT